MQSTTLPAGVHLPVLDNRWAQCAPFPDETGKLVGGCSMNERRVREKVEVLSFVGTGYQLGGMMMVGEAPGGDEVSAGVPFVGKAGQVLDALLLRADIDRSTLVLANAVACRPPGNKMSEAPFALEACNSRLLAEVWTYQPRVIVALGDKAMTALIGRVTREEKKEIRTCDVCNGAKEMPTEQATWLAEKTRAGRIKKGQLTIFCKPCSGSGTRRVPVGRNKLVTDYGITSIAGAVVDVQRNPEFTFLTEGDQPILPPSVRYIVPTYHPAWIMRDTRKEDDKKPSPIFFMPHSVMHLRKAARLLTEDAHFDLEPKILSSDADADWLREYLAHEGVMYAVDIETEGPPETFIAHEPVEDENGYVICDVCRVGEETWAADKGCSGPPNESKADRKHRVDPLLESIVVCGVSRFDTPVTPVVDWRADAPELKRVMLDFLASDIPKTFHNGPFDVCVIENRERIRVEGWVSDTNIKGRNIWPGTAKADVGIPLDVLVHTHTDAPPWKPRKKVKGRPKFDTFEQLCIYNAGDCRGTVLTDVSLADEYAAEQLNPELFQLDLDTAKIMLDMQSVGLPINLERLYQIGVEQKAKREEAYVRFRELAGGEVNVNSHPQLADVLFKRWGLPVLNRGKSGPSTDGDTLRQLQERHEGVRCLISIREAVGAERVVAQIRRLVRDGWAHPVWRSTAAKTGRTSSSPNFQNIPEWIRQVVEAPEGWIFVGADYAALEMRLLAAACGEHTDLFKFVNRPEDEDRKLDPDYDIHSHMTAVYYRDYFTSAAAYVDVAKYAGDPSGFEAWLAKEAKARQKKLRGGTKNVLYASNYMAGDDTVLRTVRKRDPGARMDEVKAIKAAYLNRFPEIVQHAEFQLDFVRKTRCLFSYILGRRLKFPMGDVAITEAADIPIQSSAGDVMNLKCREFYRRKQPNWYPVAQVHDHLLALVPEEDGDACVALMDEVLPMRVNFGKGEMLLDAKAKKGKTWDKV